MKYYMDCEFIEGWHKPLFGKRRHFIDLISIGIVCEDGREYYAVSNEFNFKDADQWVIDNVLSNMLTEWIQSHNGDERNTILDQVEGVGYLKATKVMQKSIGKSNKQIAEEILNFCRPKSRKAYDSGIDKVIQPIDFPEFYAYYADYDWVLFCSLFGRMIDLPKGFPKYCIDLKQMMDEKAIRYDDHFMSGKEDLKTRLSYLKNKTNYPKQENEHNALDDAKWNKRLHEFIVSL